jgi:hypothetical protein
VEEKESTTSSIDSPQQDQCVSPVNGSAAQLQELALSGAPLVVLMDDKRNHVAWLRCAPRRRSFEYPLLPATTAFIVETPSMRSLPLTKAPAANEESVKLGDDVPTGTYSASTTSGNVDDAAADNNDVDVAESSSPTMADLEERDQPIIDVGILNPSMDTSQQTKPERGLSLLGDSTCSDEEEERGINADSPEIEKAGSTITEYKRKLADLQRRHDAVIKMIQRI